VHGVYIICGLSIHSFILIHVVTYATLDLSICVLQNLQYMYRVSKQIVIRYLSHGNNNNNYNTHSNQYNKKNIKKILYACCLRWLMKIFCYRIQCYASWMFMSFPVDVQQSTFSRNVKWWPSIVVSVKYTVWCICIPCILNRSKQRM
jgi:hypothetical protein